MREEGFDYEGVRSENLKALVEIVMGYGLYGPPLDKFFYYANQAQAELDGDAREYIGALEDELNATKNELKIINGQLTKVLNSWEAQRGRLDRRKRDLDKRKRMLDERDARTAEEISAEQVGYWKGRAERASAQVEEYREKLGRVLELAHEMEESCR